MSNKLKDKRILKILVSNAFLRAWRLVFKLFVNLYIWKETNGNVQFLALFNIIFLVFHWISFVNFAHFVKQSKNRNLIHIISLLWYISVYGCIIFLWENLLDYAFLFALFLWIFNGMYWINYHTTVFEFTHFRNRGNFEGIKKSLQLLVWIIVPSFIGLIITLDFFSYGYEFAFSFGIFFLLISLFMGNLKIEKNERQGFYFLDTFKKSVKDKDIFRSLYTYTFSWFSFSNNLLEVIIPIIIFARVWRELDIGLIVSFFSIMSMFGAYLFGKFVDYSYYRKIIVFSGWLYALSLLGFILFPYTTTMVIFSSLFSFFLVFFTIPQKVISDNVLHKIKDYKNCRAEYMVVRELFLLIWWIISFSIIYFIGSLDMQSIAYIFYIMIFFTLVSIYSLSKIDLDKVERFSNGDIKEDV